MSAPARRRPLALEPSFWVGGALLVALSAGLAFVPLFDILGFEFALAMTPLTSLVAGLVGVASTTRALQVPARPQGPPRRLPLALAATVAACARMAVLLVPPVGVIVANALRVRTCDYIEGAQFYVVGPGGSALLCAALGVACALATASPAGPRPRRARALFVALVLTSVGLGLHTLYREPPVFAFDPFVGWFPGPLYDEVVELGAPWLWHRAMSALAVAGALAAAHALHLRHATPSAAVTRPWLVAAACAAGALGLRHEAARFGFAYDRPALERALGGRVSTRHFDIVYDASASAADVRRLAEDHEYRYAQLVRLFGEPAAGQRITSWVFRDEAQKRALFGAAATMVAKPWLGEMYLHGLRAPHPTLAHELAHALAAPFAPAPFHVAAHAPLGLAVDQGLTEGLAVAAAWGAAPDRLTPHQWAAAMRKLGILPDLARILSPTGFWRESSTRAYTTTGSFVRWLMDTRADVPRVMRIYGGASFEDAIGAPLPALVAEWHAFLDAVPMTAADHAAAELRLRRPAIFAQPCAHEIAQLRAEAGRLQSSGRPGEAIDVHLRILGFEPDEPRNLRGHFDAQLAAGLVADAQRTGERLLAHPRTDASTAARVREGLADAAWRAGDVERARTLLGEALAQHLSYDGDRLLTVKREALSLPEPHRARVLRFVSGEADRRFDLLELHDTFLELPGYATVAYLIGRQLAGGERWAEARRYFDAARARGLDPLLVPELDRQLALCALGEQRRDDAREAYERVAASDRPEAERLEARDLAARLRWLDSVAADPPFPAGPTDAAR